MCRLDGQRVRGGFPPSMGRLGTALGTLHEEREKEKEEGSKTDSSR